MLNSEAIVECVPNFSEGADEKIVRQIVCSMNVFGVSLLDWSMDAAHNRSVATIAGPPEAVAEAAVRAVCKAAELIDLTRQTGVHPRIGAADVIPFVPVRNYSLGQCAALARNAAMNVWRRCGVPSYLYEAAATRPDRMKLEDVRRGQFEGLREEVKHNSARWPDIGGPELHRTAGASAIGARNFLVAYNLFLDNADLGTARSIAREVRASSGGMAGVKAMGVMVDGRAQLSMNITDIHATPMRRLYTRIEQLCVRSGASVGEAELIGLIPEEIYATDANWLRPIPQFDPNEKVLERRLELPLAWPM